MGPGVGPRHDIVLFTIDILKVGVFIPYKVIFRGKITAVKEGVVVPEAHTHHLSLSVRPETLIPGFACNLFPHFF